MGRKKENGKNGFEEKVRKVMEQLEQLSENDYYELAVPIAGHEVYVGFWAKNGKGSYAIKFRRSGTHPASAIVKIRSKAELEALEQFVNFMKERMFILEAVERLNGSSTTKTVMPKGKILQF